jgi:hypothetical protein
MIRWREAYERLKTAPDFGRYFGSGPGSVPPPSAFRYLAYTQILGPCAGSASPIVGFGNPVGPLQQNFPAGAVILGITATAFQEQTATGAYQYAPSATPGRRDLFGLAFQYTNDEIVTPGGLILANALLGDGNDTIFPGKELLIPPSQGLLATAASHTVAPSMFVHVVYHCMVPRAVG